MATLTFDTLKFANRLKVAGANPQVAEAEASALSEVMEINFKDLATQEILTKDLKALETNIRTEMKAMDTSLRGEMKSLETSLRSEMKTLDTSLRSEMTSIRAEMSVMKWMLGFIVAGVMALILKAFF